MKKTLLAIMAFTTLTVSAQQDTLKYRVLLADKAATTYVLERPEEFLSQKALLRRAKQKLVIDSTDLPVCQAYVDAIKGQGVNIVTKGKWENFVTVSCNDSTAIDRIATLPFVRNVEKVWMAPNPSKKQKPVKRDTLKAGQAELENYYGIAYQQISMSNGDKLHEAGFKGQGMTIAIMDAGFHNVDVIPAMSNINIVGVKDFVDPTDDIYAESSHGLGVLSCMGMNQPHYMVGTAPEASYWLFRTEDEYSEHLVEQDYWAAAIEYADSVGVDVINTSLGYYTFDDKTKDYTYRDLNGRTALMSRQASRIADKGMLLVCSAGNAGMGSWKKITPPGDAANVITVGAIRKNSELAPFSSIGNTTDNRIKPDVVAVGAFADAIGTNGQPTPLNGTSFSAPIMCGMVACLWQSLPHLTAKEVISLVQQSGDRAEYPDNIYGYGIPDMWKAYNTALPVSTNE